MIDDDHPIKKDEVATADTPQQREAKAAALATEMRHFQWEVRFYIFVAIIYILIK